jgi:hypothetical protein
MIGGPFPLQVRQDFDSTAVAQRKLLTDDDQQTSAKAAIS